MSLTLEGVAKLICQDINLEMISSSGEGTFKETYHVLSQEKGPLALKVFKEGKVSERTQREIDAMKTCDHPNIGKLLKVSTYEFEGYQYLYLLEEFLSGGTLTEKIKSGPMAQSDFYYIAPLLLDALSHISSHNLVHRDIKPDNIMFREDNRTPVIVDFGLVRDLGNESLTKSWLLQGPGSPFFSAPEQLNNEKELIDWRTDQFSLGVSFSLAKFGLHPYKHEGDSQSEVVSRLISREKCSELFIERCEKEELSTLVKMVAPWPIERFRTTKQLQKAWFSNL